MAHPVAEAAPVGPIRSVEHDIAAQFVAGVAGGMGALGVKVQLPKPVPAFVGLQEGLLVTLVYADASSEPTLAPLTGNAVPAESRTVPANVRIRFFGTKAEFRG